MCKILLQRARRVLRRWSKFSCLPHCHRSIWWALPESGIVFPRKNCRYLHFIWGSDHHKEQSSVVLPDYHRRRHWKIRCFVQQRGAKSSHRPFLKRLVQYVSKITWITYNNRVIKHFSLSIGRNIYATYWNIVLVCSRRPHRLHFFITMVYSHFCQLFITAA